MDAVEKNPEQEAADREAHLVLAFLKDRDVNCPACGYNLRDLTSGACPECQMKIELHLAEREVKLGFYALTIAHGIFCAMFATILLLLTLVYGEAPPPEIGAIIFVGIVSGAVAITVIFSADAFVRQPQSSQAISAELVWFFHLLVYMLFIGLVL